MLFDPTDFNPEFVEHIRTSDDPRVRYKFRARVRGQQEYTCVFCGWHNRFPISPNTWTHRCDNESCRRYLGVGTVGYTLPNVGVRIEPPDLVIPRNLIEMYPEGDLARWRHGQTIHEVRVLAWPEPSTS